jgi:hypothetical protein
MFTLIKSLNLNGNAFSTLSNDSLTGLRALQTLWVLPLSVL